METSSAPPTTADAAQKAFMLFSVNEKQAVQLPCLLHSQGKGERKYLLFLLPERRQEVGVCQFVRRRREGLEAAGRDDASAVEVEDWIRTQAPRALRTA